MAYTLRNSINLTMPVGNYTITDENDIIVYSGRADARPDSVNLNSTVIDFAPIFRQLVKPTNYSNYIEQNEYSLIDSDGVANIKKYFRIYHNNEIIHTVNIYWDYKYEYDYVDMDYCEVLSYGIQDYVYPRQLIPLYIRNNSEDITQVYFNIEDYGYDDTFMGGETLYSIRLNDGYVSIIGGARVRATGNDDDIITKFSWVTNVNEVNDKLPKYKFRACMPANTVTLYWLNLNGGLSWCHFDAKLVESNNITRNQITHPSNFDYAQRGEFGIDNYNIQSYKSWVLNTNFMNNRQSELIQDLFKSPKVWMQKYDYDDLENGLITSVVITDTKSTLKTFENDKLFNYTVNIRESKTENIYA